jgi:hypothetical protein
MSVESVTEFLQFECLNVIEVDLIRALIRWGKYQMQQDLCEGGNLRSKILPGLQKIRFDSLTHQKFTELCQEQLEEVLTDGEQSSIFKSITSKDIWKPTEASPEKLTPRHGPYIFCNVDSKTDREKENRYCKVDRDLLFKVNNSAEFAGISVPNNYEIISFDLCKESILKIATGSSALITTNRGKDQFCKINPMCTLDAGITYTLKFTFSNTSRYREVYAYTIPSNGLLHDSDKLSPNIQNENCCVNLLGLVFKK